LEFPMDPLYTVLVHQKDCKKTLRGGVGRGGDGRGGSIGMKRSETISRTEVGSERL
jgi:hypothetical protein